MRASMQRLREEHAALTDLLTLLQRQLRSLERGQTPDLDLMQEILSYLTEYADCYHHMYEDMLCRRLLVRQPRLAGEIERLENEHGSLAGAGTVLQALIGDSLLGVPVPRDWICAKGSGYVLLYQRHLAREEALVLTAAEVYLRPADWLQLDTAFHWNENPLRSSAERRAALRKRIELETSTRRPGQEHGCVACSAA